VIANEITLPVGASADRCDLQRPGGKVYIVQRRIPALREG
jgi:hypothetical protein